MVSIPDRTWARTHAFVVARRGGSADVDALLARCQETWSNWRPVGIQVLTNCRTGANKLDKRRLPEILRPRPPAEAQNSTSSFTHAVRPGSWMRTGSAG